MNRFQVLSTRVGSDGWVDMNVLTPYGVVSIEFHIDEETVPSFSIKDSVSFNPNIRSNGKRISYDQLMKSLLALAEVLAGKDCWGQIEPFELLYQSNHNNRSFRIIAN